MAEISDDGDVTRYCHHKFLTEDGRPTSMAFTLRRTIKEEYLSVNWLQRLNQPNRDAEIDAVRRIYAGKFRHRNPADKIAVMKVGEVREHVRRNSEDVRSLKFVCFDARSDSSYSGIFNYTSDDSDIPVLIAEAVNKVYEA